MSEIWLVRHGETAWSRDHRHTGRTDVPLLPEGEQAAAALRERLDRPWALVLASPLARAWRTAELAGLSPEPEPDLVEWDYGPAEGLTTAQLSERLGAGRPWRVWDDVELGESLAQVAARVRRVLARVPPEGDTCLVAHGHVLRVLSAVQLGLAPEAGKHLVLRPASVSVLGHEHDWPAVLSWNT